MAAALAEVLATPPDDAFAPDLVAVPTRGMERWLSQRLSAQLGATPGRQDGVCAGVLFPSPRRLIGDALAGATGVASEEDPWLPERSVWPLLEVLEESLAEGEPWLASLSSYLGREGEPLKRSRRLGTVRHLAELFHRYAVHRPEMVCCWAAGEDPRDRAWQSELWRRLRARIGLPSPAERLEDGCARLRQDEAELELPTRISLFGLTRLPSSDVHVLRALATRREVHLFLLHPSPELWRRVAEMPRRPTPLPRQEDPTTGVPRNPLLASWGRDAREMQLVLGEDCVDHHHPLELEPNSLLRRLQRGVLADAALPDEQRPALDPNDRSVQIHSCHGRARQVEVLRDAVLHLLAEDPTLEPRDVIVMCPDIEAFAPLIHATFGTGAAADASGAAASAEEGDLRVRLADRSLRQTNPILAAVAALLELAGERVTASQVLGFADREPVRRRFGLRDDDLARLQRWIADAGIRWGFDAAHRAPFKLQSVSSGTWESGLDRLLLGVSMTEDGSRLYNGVLPLDDVESGAIELAGRLAELVNRLRQAIDTLTTAKPLSAWASALGSAADALTATAPREAWQRSELQRVLDELLADAGGGADRGAPIPLELAEIRGLLADRLAGRPTRANFRTGHLTVCTLYPMRSVPHRAVCLLGLDDGVFPRASPRDGDDLMLAAPQVGERDPRSEDRQLLLDALMAATDHLLITYTGNDERTNLPRPPAVPVGELLDAIDAVAAPEPRARDRVLVRHPLQPFDPLNFKAPDPWSFDSVMLGGAHALNAPRQEPEPFLDAPLEPAPDANVIALEDLVRFVQHPVKSFLRRRLRIYLTKLEDEVGDSLSVELDGLERWGVGQRLLDAVLTGVDPRAAYQAEIARGTLPPGKLGRPVIGELLPLARTIATHAEELAPAEPDPDPIDVLLELPGGRLLSGTVDGARGDVLLTATFSRIAAKHRLTAWVRLLAATVASPERRLTAITVGRGAGQTDICVARIEPLAEHVAREHLLELVELFDLGMREALPIYCATSAAYVAAGADDPLIAARAKWKTEHKHDGEDAEAEHLLVHRGRARFEDIALEPFGSLAHRLWDGLLAHEELS